MRALDKSPKLDNFIPVPAPVVQMVSAPAALIYGLILKQFLWRGEPPTVSLSWYAAQLGISTKTASRCLDELAEAELIRQTDIPGLPSRYEILEHPAIYQPVGSTEQAEQPRTKREGVGDIYDANPGQNGGGTPDKMGGGEQVANSQGKPLNAKALTAASRLSGIQVYKYTGQQAAQTQPKPAAVGNLALALALTPAEPAPAKQRRRSTPPPGYNAADIERIVQHLNYIKTKHQIPGRNACWTHGIEIARAAGGAATDDIIRYMTMLGDAGAYRDARGVNYIRYKVERFFFSRGSEPIQMPRPAATPAGPPAPTQPPKIETIELSDADRIRNAATVVTLRGIDHEATEARLAALRSCQECSGNGRKPEGAFCGCEAGRMLEASIRLSRGL